MQQEKSEIALLFQFIEERDKNLNCKLDAHMAEERAYFEKFAGEIKKHDRALYGDDSESVPGLKLRVDRIETSGRVVKWLAGSGLLAGVSGWVHKLLGH